jgi:Aldo/keto reductases, related to diketogulonate reductase
MAHSPLSAPGLLDDEALRPIADAHDVSTAQVVLRWNLQHGVVPIPCSTNPDHVHGNADVFGFTLSEDDMAAIDALHQPDFAR